MSVSTDNRAVWEIVAEYADGLLSCKAPPH
jgi:hypothetical protein